MHDKTDITDRVPALVGHAEGVPPLPVGYTVRAWLTPEALSPLEKGPAYTCDVSEGDPARPTRAFCRWCGTWIRKLDEAGATQVNACHPADTDGQPVAFVGDWVAGTAGIKCPESTSHEPDESLMVRMWQDGMWSFVTVHVEILDPRGRQRGAASDDAVEKGRFPSEIDPDTGAVHLVELDPLTDDYPLTQLVTEALHDLHDRTPWWRRLLRSLATH